MGHFKTFYFCQESFGYINYKNKKSNKNMKTIINAGYIVF